MGSIEKRVTCEGNEQAELTSAPDGLKARCAGVGRGWGAVSERRARDER